MKGKIKNIVVVLCTGFIVICNFKYAHEGYGIRNASPEDRVYATTARPTYRHEKEPYLLMCLGYAYYVQIGSYSDQPWEVIQFTGVTQKEAYDAALDYIRFRHSVGKPAGLYDSYTRIILPYSTYELKCRPSGDLYECQNETDTCPEEGAS